MNIIINNLAEQLPYDHATVEDLVKYKDYPVQGTAVAVNGSLASKEKWCVTPLHEGDNITVISAAFGG